MDLASGKAGSSHWSDVINSLSVSLYAVGSFSFDFSVPNGGQCSLLVVGKG